MLNYSKFCPNFGGMGCGMSFKPMTVNGLTPKYPLTHTGKKKKPIYTPKKIEFYVIIYIYINKGMYPRLFFFAGWVRGVFYLKSFILKGLKLIPPKFGYRT